MIVAKLEVVLTTEALLAWLIVAIGVLGFIVAQSIQKWYKAILPAILALAIIAFGLYCVVTISNRSNANGSPDDDESGGLGLSESPPPTRPAKNDLAAKLTAKVLPTHYLSQEKQLMVSVEITNTGRKTVAKATVTCDLPYRRNPRAGKRLTREFVFDKGLKRGDTTNKNFAFQGVADPALFGDPIARIEQAR